MKVLIVGASGATGRLVARQLIKRNIQTRILVRQSATLPEDIPNSPLVELVTGSISELDDTQIEELLRGCSVIVSCLGHNISLKGIFGKPHNLVFDAVRRISAQAGAPPAASGINATRPPRLILMSTTGYTNTSLGERNTIGERALLGLLRLCLPPHRDNMKAAEHLVQNITVRNSSLEWVAVRPDTLFNEDTETPYRVSPSPISSPIFNAGRTSRMQVAHFIAELITNPKLWMEWKYKTPVVYTA